MTLNSFVRLVAVCLSCAAIAISAEPDLKIERLQDAVTGRSVWRYVSPNHQTHHYYIISPWSPDEKLVTLFEMEPQVDKLTARGLFPGALWVMNADGSGRRKLVDGLKGNYHVGVSQFWGPEGKYIYFRDTSRAEPCMARVAVGSGKRECIETPVPCSRLSPDGKKLTCGNALEQGIYDLESGRYERLVTRERVLALTPNKQVIAHSASALQNTRFSPSGDKMIIVHRDLEDFPKLVEMFVYDFASGQLRFLAHDLHHPSWRPDGKAVLFVRWDDVKKKQAIWEVDAETSEERILFDAAHVPAGHPSYHPTKQHLIVTDCYGGELGDGLALIDTKKNTITQLVTIPLGAKPEPPADERFPFRNWGIWMPARKYLNEPRPVWNADGTKILFSSQESGRLNLYFIDTSDL